MNKIQKEPENSGSEVVSTRPSWALWERWLGPLLVLMVAIAYFPVVGAGFVDFDDNGYVFSNRTVMAGLTWKGLRWASTTGFLSNWHPITWLSHMLDCSVFGVTPTGPHVMNVALHATDSVLLLVLLRRITGAVWPSALVAALFAIHPTHVESVAWISERKDVLSTLFWLLTTLAYAQWTQERRPRQWLAVIGLFAMGLLTKPTLVSLPVTLLLLDVWPLERITWRNLFRPREAVKVVVEKMPLFVMSAISCAITVFVQRTAMGCYLSLRDCRTSSYPILGISEN